MSSKSEKKRTLILDRAKQVFIRKGYSSVTMKDIIDECEISRGGIYVYFSSVDEIFMEVINRHNQVHVEKIKIDIQDNRDFKATIDRYFQIKKDRLLHIEDTLLLAVFEFYIANKHKTDKDFFSGTFAVLENGILEIFNRGVAEGYLNSDYIQVLAENILCCIKGLETLALSSGITEELIDKQFDFCKRTIFSMNQRGHTS